MHKASRHQIRAWGSAATALCDAQRLRGLGVPAHLGRVRSHPVHCHMRDNVYTLWIIPGSAFFANPGPC